MQHVQSKSHSLRIIPSNKQRIPVLIGPSLPSRTNSDCHEQYARLMLMLFKPWRTPQDLLDSHTDWRESFDTWNQSGCCSIELQAVMNNIELVHESKSARDSQRNNHIKNPHVNLPTHINQTIPIESNDAQTETEDFILQTLHGVDNLYSHQTIENLLNIENLQNTPHFNIFNFQTQIYDIDGSIEDATETHDYETTWKKVYESRKKDWRQQQKTHETTSSLTIAFQSPHFQSRQINICHTQSQSNITPNTPIQQSRNPEITILQNLSDAVTIDNSIQHLISKWTLNDEQAIAFQLIAHHASFPKNSPLRLYIGGAAGTGKSRVIDAACNFFKMRGEIHRIKLLAFMGIAAANIEGTTLHSALCLGQIHNTHQNAQSFSDLQAMWVGTDWAIIDEQSMISCELFADVSSALSKAKGNTEPFGGINLVCVGDFAQLPPVRETKLFTRWKPSHQSLTTRGHKKIMGRLLWLSIQTVIILKKQCRQLGDANERFVQLLTRLCEGICTKEDFQLLNTKLIENCDPQSLFIQNWSSVPIIVSDNAEKDWLNEHAVKKFTQTTGQSLHWYYAEDYWKGSLIQDGTLVAHL